MKEMQQFTEEQGIVITGFTGLMACDFSKFHEDVEKRIKRPILTHEFGDKELWVEIKEAYRDDFVYMITGEY